MSSVRRVLFLSLRPEYADLILCGEKTVELRRRKPDVQDNDIVILYAASPVKSILGTARVQSVVQGTVTSIWRDFGSETGITQSTYKTYFDNSVEATAIRLRKTKRLSVPLTLDSIRRIIDGFTPPQSYRYLSAQEGQALITG
jgi:predicted transcriptional regulator